MAESSAITALSRVELGAEGTPGQVASMGVLWRGTGSLKDTRKILEVSENVGTHAPRDNTVTVQQGGELTLEQALTFEQFPIVLSAGYALTGPVSDGGGGSGKIWTADMPFAGSVAVPTTTYTIHETHSTGGTTFAEEAAYGFVSEYGVKGAPGDALQVSSTWLTNQVSLSMGEVALAAPATYVCPFGNYATGGLYIDPVGNAIGTTAVATTLIGWELSVKTGLMPAYTADSLSFSILKYTRPDVTLKVTFEMNSNAEGEKTAWRNQTLRKMRIKHTGASLTTPGTAYTYRTVIFDVVGKWLTFDKIDTMDGNDVVTGTLKAYYNATAALYHQVIVVNEKTTVP